jgi:hypothetical protein
VWRTSLRARAVVRLAVFVAFRGLQAVPWQAQAPPFVVLLSGLHGNSEMRVQIAGGEDLIAIVGRLQSCAAAVQAVSNDVVDVASIMWSTCARSWWQCCGYERRHRSASESARRKVSLCCVVRRFGGDNLCE